MPLNKQNWPNISPDCDVGIVEQEKVSDYSSCTFSLDYFSTYKVTLIARIRW